MRVAVCDDDATMRDMYTDLIKLVAEQKEVPVTVDRFATGKHLLFAFSDGKHSYDIAFLDIIMPGIDGIDLGAQMRKAGFVGSIIYLTRSTDHMLPAFDVGATNYVIKDESLDSKRFERVLLRAMKEVEQKKRKYILFNGISEHRNIAIDSIRCVEVCKHICIVTYGIDESFELVSTLGKIELALVPFGFARVHKSFLVNCAKVKSFTFKQATLDNDREIPVGRKYAADFKKSMEALSEMDPGKDA